MVTLPVRGEWPFRVVGWLTTSVQVLASPLAGVVVPLLSAVVAPVGRWLLVVRWPLVGSPVSGYATCCAALLLWGRRLSPFGRRRCGHPTPACRRPTVPGHASAAPWSSGVPVPLWWCWCPLPSWLTSAAVGCVVAAPPLVGGCWMLWAVVAPSGGVVLFRLKFIAQNAIVGFWLGGVGWWLFGVLRCPPV